MLRCANETRWYFVVLTVCWCLIAAIATVSRIASDPKTERTDWMPRATRTRQLTWSRRFQGSKICLVSTDLPRPKIPHAETFFPPMEAFRTTPLALGRRCLPTPNVASKPAIPARHKPSSLQATNAWVRRGLLDGESVPVDRDYASYHKQDRSTRA